MSHEPMCGTAMITPFPLESAASRCSRPSTLSRWMSSSGERLPMSRKSMSIRP